MSIPKVVLVIEDSDADQILARFVLTKHWPDTVLLMASDGLEAISILQGCAPNYPDLILLDINMPRMNGHEFLKAWYSESDQRIPTVVVLTSSVQNEDRDLALAYDSVQDYIVKPLSAESLDRLAELV